MTKKREIYEKLKNNPRNVRFEELCKAAELFGFRFRVEKAAIEFTSERGSKKSLNFQNVKGKAKPYQVRQLLKVIEKYNLLEED